MSKLQEKYLQNQVPPSPQERLEPAGVQALSFSGQCEHVRRLPEKELKANTTEEEPFLQGPLRQGERVKPAKRV